jgi:hypothetical protein
LFPTVHKTGAIGDRAMSGDAIAEMIQRRAAAAGFTPAQVDQLGGHSLRAGFVTEAFRAGADAHAIMRQTGHRSPVMLDRAPSRRHHRRAHRRRTAGRRAEPARRGTGGELAVRLTRKAKKIAMIPRRIARTAVGTTRDTLRYAGPAARRSTTRAPCEPHPKANTPSCPSQPPPT